MTKWNFRGVAWAVWALFALTLIGCEESKGPTAGDVVSVTPIAAVTKAEATGVFAAAGVPVSPAHDVQVFRVVYLTTDETGVLVRASGALLIPRNLTTPAPLLSSQHGTTTLKNDVASVPPQGGQPYNRLEALVFGTSGYITALPDYIGYGESGSHFHPYLHAGTLASSVADLLMAVKTYCNINNILLGNKLFLTGYSEGGYATMAATKVIQEKYAVELPITASAPMAGPYDLSGTLRDIIDSATYPSPGLIAFAFLAYDRIYKLDLIGQAFMPSFAASMDTLFDGNHDLLLDVDPALSTDMNVLFQNRFLTDFRDNGATALKSRIQENDVDNWSPRVAMRLIHCRGDDIVPFKNSLAAFSNFSTNGSRRLVQLVEPAPDGTHLSCAGPAVLAAKSWFDSLK